MYKNLGTLFLECTSKYSQHKALGEIRNGKIQSTTFTEYRSIVQALTCHFLHLKLPHQSKIALLSASSLEWHLLDISIIFSGHVCVPIYPSSLGEEIRDLINQSDSRILILEDESQANKVLTNIDQINHLLMIISIRPLNPELAAKIPAHIRLIQYPDFFSRGIELSNAKEFEESIQSLKPDDLASIIYTSGTTGIPKGAMITHECMCQMLQNVKSFIGSLITPGDRTLTFLPFSHVLGRTDSYLPMIFGLEMVFVRSLDTLIDDIKIAKPTFMISVPRIFEKIYTKIIQKIESKPLIMRSFIKLLIAFSKRYFNKVNHNRPILWTDRILEKISYTLLFSGIYRFFGGQIRFFISGGAPLNETIIRFLQNSHLNIVEGYGLTETMGPCVVNPFSHPKPGTIGKPIGDVKIKVAEDHEILVQSKALFTGYYKNDVETNNSLKEGYFYTGDLGEVDKDGYIRITGRKKDLIITSAGKNISPQKLENLLKQIPYVSHAVIVGDKKNYLTAIIGIEKANFLPLLTDLQLNPECDIRQLAESEAVKNLIWQHIKECNKKLARFETIKKIFICPEELTPQNALLTPSLKVKKNVLCDRYQKDIDAMYQDINALPNS